MKQQTTEMGLNRTGIQTAPEMSQVMKEASDQLRVSAEMHDTSLSAIKAIKADYIEEAEAVGTIPIPTTLKGAAKAGVEALKGHDPRILLDKMGERLAFEKTGVRLYDALISKCEVAAPEVDLSLLKTFRAQEAQHFALLGACIKSLGADPTAQTPSADTAAVEGQGVLQVLGDPRATMAQAVHAILTAELVDNDGWELLVELAKSHGHDQMADQFQEALEQELEHLDHVRRWHQELILKSHPLDLQ